MTKEERALRIIEPYIEDVIKFHKTRELRNKHEIRKPLADAYYELTKDRNARTKINNGSCGSCATRAFDMLFRLYNARELQRNEERLPEPTKGEGATAKTSRRGRPKGSKNRSKRKPRK